MGSQSATLHFACEIVSGNADSFPWTLVFAMFGRECVYLALRLDSAGDAATDRLGPLGQFRASE
jgi:hypothetical protein